MGFAALALFAGGGRDAVAQAPTALMVFAAASLQTALDRLAAQWRRDTGQPVTFVYAGTSALARQIEQGAPADLFFSADLEWMDYLAGRGLLATETRANLLGNRLALVAAKDSPVQLNIVPGFDLAGALGDGRLAMADLGAVPAGKYGKAALETLGVWPAVAPHIVQTPHVRAALVLVARGEARLGIVYETDARAEAGVRVIDLFPPDSHPPVIYPVALLRDSRHADARAFLAYLRSPAAAALFEAQGFTVLD